MASVLLSLCSCAGYTASVLSSLALLLSICCSISLSIALFAALVVVPPCISVVSLPFHSVSFRRDLPGFSQDLCVPLWLLLLLLLSLLVFVSCVLLWCAQQVHTVFGPCESFSPASLASSFVWPVPLSCFACCFGCYFALFCFVFALFLLYFPCIYFYRRCPEGVGCIFSQDHRVLAFLLLVFYGICKCRLGDVTGLVLRRGDTR